MWLFIRFPRVPSNVGFCLFTRFLRLSWFTLVRSFPLSRSPPSPPPTHPACMSADNRGGGLYSHFGCEVVGSSWLAGTMSSADEARSSWNGHYVVLAKAHLPLLRTGLLLSLFFSFSAFTRATPLLCRYEPSSFGRSPRSLHTSIQPRAT